MFLNPDTFTDDINDGVKFEFDTYVQVADSLQNAA
jgi:hypothetical protein